MRRRTGDRNGPLLGIGGLGLAALVVLALMNLFLPVSGQASVVAAADRLQGIITGLFQIAALFLHWERLFQAVLRWLLAPLGLGS